MNTNDKKKVFITGAAGFVGATLTKYLVYKKYRVHILIKKESNLWRLTDVKTKIHPHFGNLSNFKNLKRLLQEINPNYIFHLAAHGTYPFQTNADEMIKTNILGTYNLLEATKDILYECFINVGSSSEYGFKNKPMKETDLIKPVSFYAATKASATLMCQVFSQQFNKPIITFRLFSVYGPYEESTRLIPVAIKAALRKKVLKLTAGKQRRDFIYIDDVTQAFRKAMIEKNINGEIFNIGTGKQYTNLKIARVIQKCSSHELKIDIGGFQPRSWDTNFWVANISKTKSLLNWEPKYTLEEGLSKTYKWFSKNLNLYVQLF